MIWYFQFSLWQEVSDLEDLEGPLGDMELVEEEAAPSNVLRRIFKNAISQLRLSSWG